MTKKEVDRLMVIKKIEEKKWSQVKAAKALGVSDRQMRRIWKRYRARGEQGLVSKKRGKASNRRIDRRTMLRAVKLIEKHYTDFGPTLAQEKLAERHGIKLSVETVRKAMISNGLWKAKKAKRMRIHQRRIRRESEGELVQIDGSPHDWFEGRAAKCSLLVAVDDATSKIQALHFVPAESTEGYYELIKSYIKQHGKPLAFYSDKHSIFRVSRNEKQNGTRITQLGRALKQLDIQLICANSPQAKGRVERTNGVLQDRLIKEMRLKKISSIEEANMYAQEFIEFYNNKFSVQPANLTNSHRAVENNEPVEDILANHENRVLSKNLTFQYQNTIYQVKTEHEIRRLRHASITIIDNQDTGIKVQYQNRELSYSTYIEAPKVSQGQISNGKDLEVHIRKRPSKRHPWRR